MIRIRRCPRCRGEFRGGDIRPVQLGAGHWHAHGAGSLRSCPACGREGYTYEFPIVTEVLRRGPGKHTAGNGGRR